MTHQPFFILGNPRSGTSLLRSLLNAHPSIIVPPECGFVLWLQQEWGNADWSNIDLLEPFASAVLGCRKFETWGLGKDAILAQLRDLPITDYPDAVSRVFLAYAAKKGKSVSHWGDKNNYYVNKVPELLGLFPNARFIHIVRDARDVACSYRELSRRTIRSTYRPELATEAMAIAEEWFMNNQHVVEHLGDHPAYHRLRYEDLVQNLDGTLSCLCAALGVKGMGTTPDAHIRDLDEPEEFFQWKEKLARPVDDASVGRYASDLTRDDIDTIRRIAGPMMDMFGYTA